ncbi:MAG: MBL fold metallo-hydrolase [Armatimonadota bacterium]
MYKQIAENIYWVGVVDWELEHFHGHELSTQRGSSYNAYLIKDDKNVLVDTVWTPYEDEFMQTLSEIIDPADLDYIIANHSEVDHAGAMSELMRHATNAEVIVSKRGLDSFAGNYHHDWNVRAVETGETLDIGKNQLVFIEAPMLHWPDSMFTYVSGANILMPNDAFGQHYATSGRFNDEVNQDELWYEALKYYVNILTPFSRQVSKKIDELVEMDVPVDMIAPSHGVIWRDNPMQIVEKYKEWAAQEPEQSAVILYDTMWDATGKMARAIGEGLDQEDVPYKIHHMATSDRNDVLVDVFKARTIAVGSPTFNLGVLGGITPILEEMRGLKLQNKLGAAFGSYGWAPKSVQIIEELLERGGFELARDGLLCKWQPGPEEIKECRQFGRDLAEATKKPVE